MEAIFKIIDCEEVLYSTFLSDRHFIIIINTLQ